MNRPRSVPKTRRSFSRPGPSTKKPNAPRPAFSTKRPQRPRATSSSPQPTLQIVERVPEEKPDFRIVIAIHRPRYRRRFERAVAREGWEVLSLLNKQDPVGQVSKPPRPPDILILSGDFGRQRTYGIFRAVQKWRSAGMKIVGFVDDCETAPDEFPDASPQKLCDLCLLPPIKTAEMRDIIANLYQKMRKEPAPPMLSKPLTEEEDDEED